MLRPQYLKDESCVRLSTVGSEDQSMGLCRMRIEFGELVWESASVSTIELN